ncbi:MAG TPA: hypothetical protein DD719_01195, partial [Desulfotomaculum sp.]|nr:hypothetical protein [Desulfotomaculum sp.]
TLDGSNPTIYSKKYFNPFVFEYKHSPVLLKGMASKNGVNSEPAAFDYKILPPPQVIALTPPDKATSVGLNAVVSATFDLDVKAADLSGVTMKTGGLTVEGISASLTGRVLTIAHPGLSPSRAYIVTIPAGTVRSILYDTVNDLITWQFSTSAGPPPLVNGWAVLAGISNYREINDLNYSDDDARDMYNRLISERWKSERIKLLIDAH